VEAMVTCALFGVESFRKDVAIIKKIRKITMFNKFLQIYALLGMMFCSLSTPGYSGQYTKAFEDEMIWHQCANLQHYAHTVTTTYRGEPYTLMLDTKIGESIGPLGTTSHYEKRPVAMQPVVFNQYHIECTKCHERIGPEPCKILRVSLTRTPEKTTLMVTTDCRKSFHPCTVIGPSYSNGHDSQGEHVRLLREIGISGGGFGDWADVLKAMWARARRLDGDSDAMDEMIYEVRAKKSCCCCCTIQ